MPVVHTEVNEKCRPVKSGILLEHGLGIEGDQLRMMGDLASSSRDASSSLFSFSISSWHF